MQTQINLAEAKAILEQGAQRLASGQPLDAATALKALLEFAQGYSISQVDAEEPEDDMLLFEYGLFNSGNVDEHYFTVGFTRQVRLHEDEEYYQLALRLNYNPAAFGQLGGCTLWSVEYDSLAAWASAAQETAGFQAVCSQLCESFTIVLDET
jgi:hypothetical protein